MFRVSDIIFAAILSTLTALPAVAGERGPRPQIGVDEPVLSRALSIAKSPDGEILAVGHADKTIRFWHWRTGRLVKTIESSYAPYRLYFLADGEWIAVGGVDRDLRLIEISTGAKLAIDTRKGTSLQVLNGGHRIAFSNDDFDLEIRDLLDDASRETLATRSGRNVQLSADGNTLVYRDYRGLVAATRESGGWTESVATSSEFEDLALSPDGRHLVLLACGGGAFNIPCNREHQAELWSVRPLQRVAFLPNLVRYRVADGFFSDDSKVGVTLGGGDDSLDVFDTATGETRRHLTGHLSDPTAVVFVDDRILASSAWDGTARVWDVAAGRLLSTHYALSGGRSGYVTVLPDGSFVASDAAVGSLIASDDGWGKRPLDAGELAKRVGRFLTSPISP